MNIRMKLRLALILFVVGSLGVVSAIAIAADYDFAGTWKGTYTAAAPAPGTPAGGATPAAAAPAGGATPAAGDGASGGGGRTRSSGGGASGGFGGAGGGVGGTGGFPSSGPQKITLRVKVNKEKDKATGNFTMGSSSPEDIREGKIAGNKLTFKTGQAPAAIYDYDAVLIGEDLTVTRTAEGGKGGRPQSFTLKNGK